MSAIRKTQAAFRAGGARAPRFGPRCPRTLLAVFALVPALVSGALFAATAAAELLVWDFELSEDRVRNGPGPDGSTDSPGRATARLELDTETNELHALVEWEGLVGSLRGLHVHGPAVPGRSNHRHVIELLGAGIPEELARTEGRFEMRRRLEPFEHGHQRPMTPGDVRRILEAGLGYLNLHTTVFPGGELRGNLGEPARSEASKDASADAVGPS